MSSKLLIAAGTVTLLTTPLMYKAYLLLHRWRYGHRIGYDFVSLFELSEGEPKRSHDAFMTSALWFLGGLTMLTIGLNIYASQNGLLNEYNKSL